MTEPVDGNVSDYDEILGEDSDDEGGAEEVPGDLPAEYLDPQQPGAAPADDDAGY